MHWLKTLQLKKTLCFCSLSLQAKRKFPIYSKKHNQNIFYNRQFPTKFVGKHTNAMYISDKYEVSLNYSNINYKYTLFGQSGRKFFIHLKEYCKNNCLTNFPFTKHVTNRHIKILMCNISICINNKSIKLNMLVNLKLLHK